MESAGRDCAVDRSERPPPTAATSHSTPSEKRCASSGVNATELIARGRRQVGVGGATAHTLTYESHLLDEPLGLVFTTPGPRVINHRLSWVHTGIWFSRRTATSAPVATSQMVMPLLPPSLPIAARNEPSGLSAA